MRSWSDTSCRNFSAKGREWAFHRPARMLFNSRNPERSRLWRAGIEGRTYYFWTLSWHERKGRGRSRAARSGEQSAMPGRGGIWTLRCGWPLSSRTGCQGATPTAQGWRRSSVRSSASRGMGNPERLLLWRAVIEGRTSPLVEAPMAHKMTKEEITAKFRAGEIDSDTMLALMADANRKPARLRRGREERLAVDLLRRPAVPRCPCPTSAPWPCSPTSRLPPPVPIWSRIRAVSRSRTRARSPNGRSGEWDGRHLRRHAPCLLRQLFSLDDEGREDKAKLLREAGDVIADDDEE